MSTMSSLLPNHHRSASDRLLSNYLTSQKQLTTALLTLLSHSHSSTSSLLAYVTSSPGIPFPVRRAVQNAAFEGPISGNSVYPSGLDQQGAGGDLAKWTGYVASLENFRKDLKDVHSLEEELSQVKRDREILVSRLIKATKSRPTKSDIRDAAKSSTGGSQHGGSSSVLSFGSDNSNTTAGGRSKRANKLAEAQAEVLGCEEHLRDLEVRLEEERGKVMRHGLLERFRAMDDVGRMWQKQAKLGIAELGRAHASNGHDGEHLLPANAFEVDSNGSLAPSQSASQVGYDSDPETHQRRPPAAKSKSKKAERRIARPAPVSGSVTGSIAEEDENDLGSSASEDEGNFVVHENSRPGIPVAQRSNATLVPNNESRSNGNNRISVGQGVPSITAMRPAPARQTSGGSSNSGYVAQPRRRTQSEIGYNAPRSTINRRQSLKRTGSHQANGSDTSSIRQKKKGGFFKAIAKLFKSPANSGGSASKRGGADSPPLTSRSTGGWNTRTDSHIKHLSGGGTFRRNANDSSDDEGPSNLVAVTNMGNSTWSVDQVGKPAVGSQRKSRSDLGAKAPRSESASTITGARLSKAPKANGTLPKGTVVKPAGSVTGSTNKRLRQGSITRAGASAGVPSIASVIEGNKTNGPLAPKMMEIPKAPKSQVTPQMYSVTAPPPVSASLLQSPPPAPRAPAAATSTVSRASTVTASQPKKAAAPSLKRNSSQTSGLPTSASAPVGLGAPVSSGTPVGMNLPNESVDSIVARHPLPPSKSLAPPSKSAMRMSSPVPFIVTAPGPVVADKVEEKPKEVESAPAPVVIPAAPMLQRSNSVATATETESVYESAEEEYTEAPTTADNGGNSGGYGEDSEGSDLTVDPSKYQVIENAPRAIAAAPAPVAATPAPVVDKPVPRAAPSLTESAVERRKSVRMAVPGSPAVTTANKASPLGQVEASGQSNGNGETGWNSRVGRIVDSSDEEDNAEYAKAKLNLTSSTRKMKHAGKIPAAEVARKRSSKSSRA